MDKRKIQVVALDLEGTLISNAMSQIPRPGLFAFLEQVSIQFPRVVMYTTVKEDRFRSIANALVLERHAPEWFRSIKYIPWHGGTKDLSLIPGVSFESALLVDDFEIYVHPGQESQWVKIRCFEQPYANTDNGLQEALAMLSAYVD